MPPDPRVAERVQMRHPGHPLASTNMEKKPRIFTISFASVYPLYVKKALAKGRTQAELDEVIAWLTGYRGKQLQKVIDSKLDLDTFFAKAPRLNPNARLITGVVCGVRVEEVADPLMQKIRYLDKLVDELAKGKQMGSILRSDSPAPTATGAKKAGIRAATPRKASGAVKASTRAAPARKASRATKASTRSAPEQKAAPPRASRSRRAG
jgi:hypothetical protein